MERSVRFGGEIFRLSSSARMTQEGTTEVLGGTPGTSVFIPAGPQLAHTGLGGRVSDSFQATCRVADSGETRSVPRGLLPVGGRPPSLIPL